jgi:thiol:disulfide interchange protein DsbD
MVAGGAAILFGILLGAIHLDWYDGGLGVKIRKVLGIAVATLGGYVLWVSIDLPPPENEHIATAEPKPGEAGAATKKLLTWEHSEKDAAERAQREKRPLMVDFTADWCGACKELAKHTFSDPRVMEKAGNFVAVKVDATNDEDPQVEQVKGKYKVVGLPTVVIYDSTGKEHTRFTEFVAADKFLAAIENIR